MDTQQAYNRIIEKIVAWGQQQADIRALIVIGSRARTTLSADDWSDLDILMLTEDVARYIESAAWLQTFGTPLLTFIERTFEGGYERRVLYEGFLDVDFALDTPSAGEKLLQSPEVMHGIFKRGYRFLLDKDGWEPRLAAAVASAQAVETVINNADIANNIHDYWYHCVWLTKKLERGELWSAVGCLNGYMQSKLLQMIEWYTHLHSTKPVDTWHGGRFLHKWTEPWIVESLPGCFADYDAASIQSALQKQMALYHRLAVAVAQKQGIDYPDSARQQVMVWVKEVGE